MRHDFIDRYSRLDSYVHRVPAGLKLYVAVALVIATVLIPFGAWSFFTAEACVLLAIAFLSRIPVGFLVKRLLTLEPVVLAAAVLNLFREGGTAILIAILLRSSLCLFTMILLSNTTRFSDILIVLRRLRVPPLLITTLALMYRYVFVLIDEGERMTRARASRSLSVSRAGAWKSLALLVGQLFLRSSERSERIYAAMCARGWK